MAKSILRFYSTTLGLQDIGDFIGDAVNSGTFQNGSKHKVTLEGTEGGRIVFKGKFKLANDGSVTGGTVTGYSAFVDGERLMKATGYDVPFNELASALGTEEMMFLLLTCDQTLGSNRDDTMFGISKLLKGGRGDDMIVSGFRDKTIVGEAGNDLIVAGSGNDDIFGGKGRDDFAFTSPDDGVDRLRDFDRKQDQIGLDDGGFAALGGTIEEAELLSGADALTAGQHLIYDQESGKLWWDADGVGGTTKMLLARLPDGTKLGAANFFVDDFT